MLNQVIYSDKGWRNYRISQFPSQRSSFKLYLPVVGTQYAAR